MQGMRTVCVPTWEDKVVDVCTYRSVQKDGVRKVCQPYHVKKLVDQRYCEMVKYETTVKVPVCTPVPCASPCAPSGMGGGCGGCR
jgi:hypothetical protein